MNISYSTWTLSSVSLSSPRLPESLSASLSPSLSLFSLLRHHHHRWKNIWTLHLSYLGASFTCSRMQKCHFTFKWSAFAVYRLPAFNNNMRKIHLHKCEYCFLGIYYTVRVKWILCCMLTSALMCEIWRKNHQCPDDQIHFYSEQQRLFSIP